jgi:glycosyltransferase involved in cell wall biosynthesis
MRVVVVLAAPPLPEGGAPGRCAVGLLRGLKAHGLDVAAVAADQHFPGLPPSDLGVEVIDVSAPPKGWRRLRRPHEHLEEGRFGERVRELARTADVLHLDQVATSTCDRGVATPSVVHIHYRVRRDRPLGPPWRNEFRWVLSNAAAERRAIRTHRYLLASSPLIAADLRVRAPGAEVVCAPLCLDPQYYSPAPLDGPPRAGIIGSATWPPTIGAMRRLVGRVWPLVAQRVPEARLVVAGRGVESLALAGANRVDLAGEVPSSSAFLSQLSLLLFPLERGSGMKVKVLEALASGVPVVTTPAGAEGIAPTDGVVVCTSDGQLADAAAQLLEDAEERRHRGAEARRAFTERYSPRPATLPVVELYRRMAA